MLPLVLLPLVVLPLGLYVSDVGVASGALCAAAVPSVRVRAWVWVCLGGNMCGCMWKMG